MCTMKGSVLEFFIPCSIFNLKMIFLEIYCPGLETTPNSTLTSMDNSVNGTAQFVCNKGYLHTNGTLQRKCLASGDWSGLAPVCKGRLLLIKNTIFKNL